MKATQTIASKTLDPFSKPLLTTRSVGGFVGASTILLGVIRPTRYSAPKYADYLPDRTMCLLTAPVTTARRQALHAQNFKNLPIVARPVYLYSVAFAVGYTVASDGEVPESEMLSEHLKDVMVTSIYDAAAVPPEYSENLAEFLSVVHTKLKQLNLLISAEVVNNISYQEAMYAGAADSFMDWWWD